MRNMKRNFAVLAATVMAVCSIALTGCQQKLEPAEEMTELTIKCQRVKVDVSGKEKIAWMPQDLSKFSDEVNNATFK